MILTITATPARAAIPNVGGCGAACAAIEGLCRQLACELGPQGVRVVCLRSAGSPDAPGLDEIGDRLAERAGVVLPFRRFDPDLAAGRLPTVAFVVPDLRHDMHSGPVAVADAWLHRPFSQLATNPVWRQNTRVVVTFDEGTRSDTRSGRDSLGRGGRILTIVVGPRVPPGRDATPYTHYSASLHRGRVRPAPSSGTPATRAPRRSRPWSAVPKLSARGHDLWGDPSSFGETYDGHEGMSVLRRGWLRRAADPAVAAWAVRAVGMASLIAIVVWVARSDSAVEGDTAAVAAALAVLSAAWVGLLLPAALERRLQVTALVVIAICAAILNHLRPMSPAVLAALLAMAVAAARLPVGWAVGVMAVAATAITLSEGVEETHTIPAGVSYTVAAAVLFGAATYVRALREAHRRAERIVVELQATRRAEARAATLAERARLAREMHDILAHVLSALSLQLEATALLLEQEGASDRALQQVQRAQRLAHDGLDEAQQAIGALRGDRLPGPELLPGLVEGFSQATGVPARIEVAGEPRPLGQEAGLAVYRTAQEALTNVRKHARMADGVSVALRWEPDTLTLTVQDRGAGGRGAVAADGSPRGGYGLAGMRERAELLGGELAAGRTADGFQVRLWLPA